MQDPPLLYEHTMAPPMHVLLASRVAGAEPGAAMTPAIMSAMEAGMKNCIFAVGG